MFFSIAYKQKKTRTKQNKKTNNKTQNNKTTKTKQNKHTQNTTKNKKRKRSKTQQIKTNTRAVDFCVGAEMAESIQEFIYLWARTVAFA